MPECPQCRKPLRELVRRCPSCQADLDLLVDYVSTLETGLERAERLTRAGELGQAIWTYLGVLEVDPDNAAARRQVGQVVTAVRQFDRTAPGRRWLERIRAAMMTDPEERRLIHVLRVGLVGAVVLLAFLFGFGLGSMTEVKPVERPDKPAPLNQPNDQLGPPRAEPSDT